MRTSFDRRLGPILSGLAYFGIAYASLFWTVNGEGLATLWPAAGLAVAVLASVEKRALHLVAMSLASLAANVACGITPLDAAIFTIANMTEPVLAASLLSRCPFGSPSFTDIRQVGCFAVIAVVSVVASTAIVSTAIGSANLAFTASWFATDLLGILIASPLAFMALARLKAGRTISSQPRKRLFISLSAVLIASVGAFAQDALPLLFIPMAALLWAAYVAGPFAAAAGTLVIALVGSVAIPFDLGPTDLTGWTHPAQIFFLQTFLLVSLGSALAMAAVQAGRERLVRDLAERSRLLLMSERVAKVGHWHLDLSTGKVTWSEEVFRIHGLEEGRAPTLDEAIEAYHPDDRPELVARIDEALQTGLGFRHRARIVRPNGEVRFMDVTGEVVMAGGVARSLFGVVQDITPQVETESRLADERVAALTAASIARKLSETDSLTGLANRRKVLDFLSLAVEAARSDGTSLSIALFDIDHFKRVNDRHGHPVGDAVLKRVAGSAVKAVREDDLVGRFGGEEFIVVFPGASSATAGEVGERIRAFIERDGEGGDDDPKVTTSIGVATVRASDTTESLIKRADRALYRAKAGGRNMLRVAG